MSVKVSVIDGKISNLTMMGKRLERFGEVIIIDETNGFGLDFVEKTESRFWSTTPDENNNNTHGIVVLDHQWCLSN